MEFIPDKDLLYQRVNKKHYIDDVLNIRMVFRNIGDGMSTDWSKYSKPEDTRNRAKSSSPLDNGVISLKAGKIRGIPKQIIEHTPSGNNPAHTEVKGNKDLSIQVEFSRICEWCIKPPPHNP